MSKDRALSSWAIAGVASITSLRRSPPLEGLHRAAGACSLIVNSGKPVELVSAQLRLRLEHGALGVLGPCAEPLQFTAPESGAETPQLELEVLAVTFERAPLQLAEIVSRAAHTTPRALTSSDEQRALVDATRLLHAELGREKPEPSVVRGLLEAFVAYATRACADGVANELCRALRDQQVARALERMLAEPAKPWTVAKLAKAAGLSRAQFARRFAAELGAPPLRYLSEQRLRLAAELLERDDDSLAGIAERVGYESEFAFSRAFKRFSGEAPGLYRRRIRAGAGVAMALAA